MFLNIRFGAVDVAQPALQINEPKIIKGIFGQLIHFYFTKHMYNSANNVVTIINNYRCL